MREAWVLSVSQLNEYVRRTLASDPMLSSVTLRGEISNYKLHSSGHVYFSLKDEQARLPCVMFRQYTDRMPMHAADGMRVVLTGSVSLYTKEGQYQFYATQMREDGIGDLHQQFEQLKQKLSAQGLFDASIKRALPLLPRVIGVITSPTGAVIRDIVHVASRRNPHVQLRLYPSKVQGVGAAEEMTEGLRVLGGMKDIDVIILARGGGSMEDLWAFNDEKLARAVRKSRVPVVSAVGHETDFTIADFVADMRAPTPSAAAEIVVPQIDQLQAQLNRHIAHLYQAQKSALQMGKAMLDMRRANLLAHHPRRLLAEHALRLHHGKERLHQAIQGRLQGGQQQLLQSKTRLMALSPSAVLARGYALVMQGGQVVPSGMALDLTRAATLQMHDAKIQVQLLERKAENAHGDTKKDTEAKL